MSKVESFGFQKECCERYMIKKVMLEESIGKEIGEVVVFFSVLKNEKIIRQVFEEEVCKFLIWGYNIVEEM